MTENPETTDGGDSRSQPRSKVLSVLDRYDIPELGDELVELWTTDTADRMSLRELADHVNQRLLTATLTEAGGHPLDGTATNYYRLLTSDDVSSGARIEAENELERRGIDVDQLEADFVSRQAIHTYLTKERDVTYEREEKTATERIDERLQTIQRLKNRLSAVTERAIAELAGADLVTVGSTRVTVLVRVECSGCDNQYPISTILTTGGCDCDPTDDPQS